MKQSLVGSKYQTGEQAIQHLVELERRISSYDFPSDWEEALKTILTRPKPKDFSSKQWKNVVSNTNNLFRFPHHLRDLIQHGWTLKDIFGCYRTHPCQRYDYMGLILLLGNKSIQGVNRNGIILITPTGALQTYKRAAQFLPDQITLMELEDDPAILSTSATPKNEPILNLLSAEAEKHPPLIKPEPTRAEIVVGEEVSLVRPFEEIKAVGLEKYYWYFEERAAIRHFDGGLPLYDGEKHLTDSANWQAMNDTTYKFMEDNNVDQGSVEVNQFIKKMLR